MSYSVNTHHILPVSVWDNLRTGPEGDILGQILGNDVDAFDKKTDLPYEQYKTDGDKGKFDLDSSANLINLAGSSDVQSKLLSSVDVNGDNIYKKGDVAIARWSSPKSLSCLERSPAPFAVGCA